MAPHISTLTSALRGTSLGRQSLRSAWHAIDQALVRAVRSVSLIARVTPINAVAERARLVSAVERGETPSPRWEYERRPGDPTRTLAEVARLTDASLPEPWKNLYLARIEELALEARVAGAIGTAALGRHARARFGDAGGKVQASAEAWLTLAPRDDADDERVESDSADPRSLASRMRERVRELGLAFDVIPHPPLSALAATGETAIYVATGRMLTAAAVERTVMHETLAHAAPRQRAKTAPIALFSAGTARGFDDQEGLALYLERRDGHFTSARKRDLGARHAAATWMREGADFGEVVRRLTQSGVEARAAVLVSERVFRGSDGTMEGLGREAIYLPALSRVARAVARDERALLWLQEGQVSTSAARALEAHRHALV